MEKKIKSVKLKTAIKPLPNYEICKGVTLNAFVEGFGFDRFDFKVIYPIDLIHRRKDLFEIEYEPERKFIDVRIEYDNGVKLYGEDISAISLERFFPDDFIRRNQIKVTELPEVFTKKDMIEFAYKCRHLVEPPESRIEKFISERKSNGR